MSRLLFLSAVLASASFAAETSRRSAPRVPEGFTVERVAGPELARHPMMAGFDDRGRLYVACSAGKNLRSGDLLKNPPNFIKRLEDTDGDGRFDRATVFADKMTLPMGALWYRGSVYVASPPHIWKLTDTDDDGVADKREILVDKFGFNGNAASIHGCFLGPAGRIWWCDGRHGHEFRDKSGKLVSKGKAARIFSCRPDGSDVRTHCGGGMDNPVEIDFTETGEVIGTCNLMFGRPRGDTLVHWIEGGVYPRFDQQHCLDEFPDTGGVLPPIVNFGHVAVSGTTRYRSTALGERFRNNFFVTYFNTHQVVRCELKRSGSTYTAKTHPFLECDDPDFHPTDVLEDADGSLLVIDTGGWFRIGCPASKIAKPHIPGGIWRIRRKGAKPVDDPRGLKLGFDKMPSKEAVQYLDDPRWVVREKAIERLACLWSELPIIDDLRAVTKSRKTTARARRNAIWAMGRCTTDDLFNTVGNAIEGSLSDPDESVRMAAASSLAASPQLEDVTGRQLLELMGTASPECRREFSRAAGRVNLSGLEFFATPQEVMSTRRKRVAVLCKAIAAPNSDRVLEHTMIYSVIQIADREATLPLLKDKNPTVRRAALLALNQMPGGELTREMVTAQLNTDDAALQQTAMKIIERRGWAEAVLDQVQGWLKSDKLVSTGNDSGQRADVIQGVLLASIDKPAVQSLIAKTAVDDSLPSNCRVLLLETIERSRLKKFPDAWKPAVEHALAGGVADEQLPAVRIIRQHRLDLSPRLALIAATKTAPVTLRAETLRTMAPGMFRVHDDLLEYSLKQLAGHDSPLARMTVARAVAELPWRDDQLQTLASRLGECDPLTVPLVLRAFERSKNATVGRALVAALLKTRIAASLPADQLAKLLGRYPGAVREEAKPLLESKGDDIAAQRAHLSHLLKTTSGGNVERGRAVFFSRKATCSGCHTIVGKGGRIGPDLTRIGRIRTPRDLLESIAFPSATLAREYETVIAATDAGKVHTGVIARQTRDAMVLRTAELAEVHIPRNSIERLRTSPTSIMPKGLEQRLTSSELSDLLAYLQSLK